MPAIRIDDDEIMDRLTEVFRTVGYDGATLSKLSDATGLQRASLYHRFPGGKQEMAEAILARAGERFQSQVLAPLDGDGKPEDRLAKMAQGLDGFYSRGKSPCLLDTLSFGDGGELFETHIKQSFSAWIEAIARLIVGATGVPRATARLRAEDAVLRIQGALVLARGTGKTRAFQRTLQDLPRALLNRKA